MKKFLLLILLFPLSVSAIGISKQVACNQPNGINLKPIYILWPGEIPYVDSFVKYNGKLYYFIQKFASAKARNIYIKNGNSPLANNGFITNKWSFLVEYDCARSKVDFLPIQDTSGLGHGKFLWNNGRWVDYSFTHPNRTPSCKIQQDTILNLETQNRANIDSILKQYPESTKSGCYTRDIYTYTGNDTVVFRVERKNLSTKESFFYPYAYDLLSGSEKLRTETGSGKTPSIDGTWVFTKEATDFIDNKKIFVPWVTMTQTETETNLLFHGNVIKTYKNIEYPISLLRDMNTKIPDCANSKKGNATSYAAKTSLGKEYLRICLVLRMRSFVWEYLLFYWPSISGHTISLYDIKLGKFFHHIIGTTTQIRFTTGKGILFTVSQPWLYCNQSIWSYNEGKIRKVFDECTLENAWWDHVLIDSATFGSSTIDILYKPLKLIGDSYIAQARQKYSLPY